MRRSTRSMHAAGARFPAHVWQRFTKVPQTAAFGVPRVCKEWNESCPVIEDVLAWLDDHDGPQAARAEFRAMSDIIPLLYADIGRRLAPVVFATDWRAVAVPFATSRCGHHEVLCPGDCEQNADVLATGDDGVAA